MGPDLHVGRPPPSSWIPFAGTPIEEVLSEAWEKRNGPFVFHRSGARIYTLYKVWRRVCKKAGLVGRRLHDMRRTAARDLINAGVPEKVVLQIVGWKSPAMLYRYHIVNEPDVAQTLAKWFSGTANRTVAAQKLAPTRTPASQVLP
jgi:integrase